MPSSPSADGILPVSKRKNKILAIHYAAVVAIAAPAGHIPMPAIRTASNKKLITFSKAKTQIAVLVLRYPLSTPVAADIKSNVGSSKFRARRNEFAYSFAFCPVISFSSHLKEAGEKLQNCAK